MAKKKPERPPKEISWDEAATMVKPHVVRIQTPRGSGTGFLFHRLPSGLIAIATASHVVEHCDYWREPMRIHHESADESVLWRAEDRAIFVDNDRDTAAIVVGKLLPVPEAALPLVPEDKYVRVGIDIGWLGYPAVARTRLCFFGGRISAFEGGEYLVDGVAINGVSGGPAFHTFPVTPVLLGVLSAYIPNRATGETLPGLSVVRDVSHLHEVIKHFKSLEEAKEKETPPSESPPKPPEERGPAQSTGMRV